MRHVAAYLLAVLGGNDNPSAADVKAILSSVGVEADASNLSCVINALKGKSIPQLIEAGLEKMATVPTGGSGAPGAAAVGSVLPEAAEEKKEEKKPVVSEDSSDEDMGLGLFD